MFENCPNLETLYQIYSIMISNTVQRSLYERVSLLVERGIEFAEEGGKRFGSVVKRVNRGERLVF